MIPRRNFDKDKTFRLKLKTFIFGGRKWTPLRIMNCHVPLALPPNTFLKISFTFFFFFSIHYSVGIEFIMNFTDFFLISQLALCSVTTLLYQILRIPSSYKKRQKCWGLHCKYTSQAPLSTTPCNLDTAVPLQWTFHLQPMPCLQIFFKSKMTNNCR